MSLSLKKERLKQEIPAGIHLLVVLNVKMYKKDNGELMSYANCNGIVLEFGDSQANCHEQVFWIKGFNYKDLKELINNCGLNPEQDIKKNEIIGKRFWGFFKEIQKTNTDGTLGSKTIRMFDTAPYISKHKPAHRDDPERNSGMIIGDFIEYIAPTEEFFAPKDEQDSTDSEFPAIPEGPAF